jgi:hypothetical protein
MVFRKPMDTQCPDTLREMLKDVSQDGRDLHMFTMDVMQDVLEVGRSGLFVDYPVVQENMTMADIKKNNLRPVIKNYKAENVINWKVKPINGSGTLAMVVLQEEQVVGGDEFEEECETVYRVLDLVPVDNEYRYRVRLFKIEKDPTTKELIEVVLWSSTPMVNGKPLSYIPFVFIGTDSVSCDADNPPLIDLVDVNLSHYRVTADYEHGCHFTGLPTPVISGHTAEPDEDGKAMTFNIGSTTAWVFRNPQTKAAYLEFTGQGLSALEKNLARKENQMAILGARMLEAQRTTTESANTATIRQGGEQSMLASIAATISIGLTIAMRWFAEFAGIDGTDVKIQLNKDFFPFPMDSLMMTAYVAAWQNSAISYETMYALLKRAEVVPQERSADEEQKMIEDNPPPVPDRLGMDGAASPNLKVGGKVDDKTSTELQAGKV